MKTDPWEAEIAALLNELSAVQTELLDYLVQKRRLLADADVAGLQALETCEHDLLVRLQACHDRRGELLARARDEQLPADSIRSLAQAMPPAARMQLTEQVEAASHRARLLGHHSLTNWVLTQRTLLHLSQLLEIIATGGRQRPTYGRAAPAHAGGALVDQAV